MAAPASPASHAWDRGIVRLPLPNAWVRMRRSPIFYAELAALVAWFVLAVAVVWTDDDRQMVPLSAEALVSGPSQERWYGIYFQDQHVGFSVGRQSPTADGGTLWEQRSSFRVATFGKLQEVVTAGAALTDPDARLVRFDFFMSAEQVRISARGEVHGDEIVMEVQQAGETSELRFPVERPPQVNLSMNAVLQRTELAVGKVIDVPYFDPLTLADGEMRLTVTDVEVLDNGEEAYWLTSSFSGVETRVLVTPAGETLRQESALGMASVLMTREQAVAVPTDGEPTDLIALSAVQLKGDIPGARDTRFVRLRIKGVEPERVRHQPPLQVLEGDIVTVEVPITLELPDLPVRDESELEWLESSLTIQAAHPEIRDEATRIVGDAPTRLEAVRRLNQWVYDSVQKVPSMGVPSGLEVLRSRQGDCNEHTALFVSLARAAKIPTRIAAGVVYSDRITENGAFYYHAWPEVRLGGDAGWVPVDPTFGQVPADATHVKLVEGDLDRQVEIMAVMGRLGFELVDSR